jgi:hypothetical protein
MTTAPTIAADDDVGASVPDSDAPADATNAAGVPGRALPLPTVCAAPTGAPGGPAYLHRSLASVGGPMRVGRSRVLPQEPPCR